MTDAELDRHFDCLYATSDDPWNYRGSAYEQAKYEDTLAHLPQRHYRRVLEIGCSIGVLTDRLADRADSVLGLDAAQRAIELARAHKQRSNIELRHARVPDEWPEGTFDLIVFSEVLYYLSPVERAATVALAARRLRSAGSLILVNWLGETGTPWSGETVAEEFVAHLRLLGFSSSTIRRPRYRLDIAAPLDDA